MEAHNPRILDSNVYKCVCESCKRVLTWEEQWDMNYKAECDCGYVYETEIGKIYISRYYEPNNDKDQKG